jgi:hypothetical protein
LCKIYICPHNVFLHTPRCITGQQTCTWAPLTAFQPYIGQTRPSCDRIFRTPLELRFVTYRAMRLTTWLTCRSRNISATSGPLTSVALALAPRRFSRSRCRRRAAHANVYFNHTSPHALPHHGLRTPVPRTNRLCAPTNQPTIQRIYAYRVYKRSAPINNPLQPMKSLDRS